MMVVTRETRVGTREKHVVIRKTCGITHGLLCLLVSLMSQTTSAQLVGSRGVFQLKEGLEYRDNVTRASSEAVARFAKQFQAVTDSLSEARRPAERSQVTRTPYFPSTKQNLIGKELTDRDILGFQDTRHIVPLSGLQQNKPLPEIELERATPSTRLLPGEELVTPPPPTIKPSGGRIRTPPYPIPPRSPYNSQLFWQQQNPKPAHLFQAHPPTQLIPLRSRGLGFPAPILQTATFSTSHHFPTPSFMTGRPLVVQGPSYTITWG